MGENFIRERQKEFKRRTDAAYKARLVQRDLFSNIEPGRTEEVVGLNVGSMKLTPGASLAEVARAVSTSTRIILACGNAEAVELDGEAAVQVRRAEQRLGGALRKTVRETSPEGLVRIQLEVPLTPDAQGNRPGGDS